MRMGSLDDDELAALELVAVGEPVTVDCLRRLGVADLAARLERRGLVASQRTCSAGSSRLRIPVRRGAP